MKNTKGRVAITAWVIIWVGLVAGGSLMPAIGYSAEEYTTRDLNEQLVMATLWVQTSAEFRALCYQSFNLAKMNLDAVLNSCTGSKPVAISVDVDETVIDNSAYEAFLIGNNFGYSSKTWGPWIEAGQAKAMPGATEFLNYAKEKSVEVFYITNIRWFQIRYMAIGKVPYTTATGVPAQQRKTRCEKAILSDGIINPSTCIHESGNVS